MSPGEKRLRIQVAGANVPKRLAEDLEEVLFELAERRQDDRYGLAKLEALLAQEGCACETPPEGHEGEMTACLACRVREAIQ